MSTFAVQLAKSTPATIVVPDDYLTIQEAINNANNGDIVFVRNGTYRENVVVNKTVSLVGEDRDTTVIDGNQSRSVVEITVSFVEVSGFTIQNSSYRHDFGYAGIYLEGVNHCNISRNTVIRNRCGINLYLANNTAISGNYIANNYYYSGIQLYKSLNCCITGNTLTNNREVGILIWHSSGNNVSRNHIAENYYGGVSLIGSSKNNRIVGNNLTRNRSAGVRLSSSVENNSISGNIFVEDGMSINPSIGNVVENNLVNNRPLVYLEDTTDYTVGEAGQVILINCSNIIVQNLNLSSTYAGIQLFLANNTKIVNNNITHNREWGIYLRLSINTTITQNNISNNSGDGIGISNSANSNIYRNTMTNNYEGIDLRGSSNNSISGNNIVENSHIGVRLEGSSNTIAQNNIMKNSWGICLISPSDNTTITRNNVANNSGLGIRINTSSNCTVHENNLTDNGDAGILLYNGTKNVVSENTVTNNGNGIYLYISSNNSITENDVFACRHSGICLGYSPSNIVSLNTITSNSRNGIFIDSGSNSNRIDGNTIMNNNGNGIYLAVALYNDIYENDIVNNNNGIAFSRYFGGPIDNYIYHNSFFGNTNHANTDAINFVGRQNSWDAGYPSGGNYWGNFTSVDEYSGQYQNETGIDGIIDIPYICNENNIDHYPLTKPYAGPHDVGVKMHISRTVVPEGYRTATNISIMITNYGLQTESVNFTCQTTTTTYEQLLTVTSRNTTTMIFTWNTTGLSKGNYTIMVSVEPIRDETDTADNYCTHWVIVAMVGDITGPNGWPDGTCNMMDVAVAARAFGSYPEHPRWNLIADVNQDNNVDMIDIATVARHFGETDP